MGFTDDGLGLAASIKKKYPKKKVIIYSADSEGSRFHEAFRLADDQLSKNAVPYEFESVIETMTSQLIQDGIL
jgi:DNA-binding NarL/FixJ family response regulator